MNRPRGYCGIGVYHPQKEVNLGTLWRSAMALNADFVYTVGRKYSRQSSDTPNATRHLPYYHFESLSDFLAFRPVHSRLVVVEIAPQARDLRKFVHPAQAIYMLGSEGGGVPQELLNNNVVIQVPVGPPCLNVATAGSIVLYDRLAKAYE